MVNARRMSRFYGSGFYLSLKSLSKNMKPTVNSALRALELEQTWRCLAWQPAGTVDLPLVNQKGHCREMSKKAKSCPILNFFQAK